MISLIVRRSLLLLPLFLIAGCDTVVMNPSGDIAVQQGNLIVVSTLLMLLIIVPVIALTFIFAWRYRQNNTSAKYDPDWDHSTRLEMVIWGAPLLIIIALGAITWISTHRLDPYRPLERLDANRPISADTKPLVVQVVALDWKWLFIYPEQGIATVNELVTPIDVPIRFKLTASNVMNSFYIPALAGQIYAMPGMDTTLNAVLNKPGQYEGFSANYSGAGFSDMRFKYHGVAAADFDNWVRQMKARGSELNRAGYLALEKPSEREPVRHYGVVAPDLYNAIVNRCVAPGTECMSDIMAADANRTKAAIASRNLQKGKAAEKVPYHVTKTGNEASTSSSLSHESNHARAH
jgi:cytochrome o ubiquinol oxidase subunit 2